MLVVIALGGNALLQRGEKLTAQNQQRHALAAAKSIAQIARDHDVVLCHGNGPQVGLLALQAAHYTDVPAYPFDLLVAETQGMIGALLQTALKNELPDKSIVTLLTQTLVNANDAAFTQPTKFIGPVYADTLALEKLNVPYAKDTTGFRRVIASPAPQHILELETIKLLITAHHLVICNGGGGIPVIEKQGKISGIEAVIDKDASSALLAEKLQADRFIILTDVPCVYRDYGTPQQHALHTTTVAELQDLNFSAGSMGPKIKAACAFAKASGKIASIGALNAAEDLLMLRTGTHVQG